MDSIKAQLSARWWVVTGVATIVGLAATFGAGLSVLQAAVLGLVLPTVGAFAHVLDRARD